MTKLLVIALSLTAACVTTTDDRDPIPRWDACETQASFWCARAGFRDSPGCRAYYMHECTPTGPDGTIEVEDQAACLEAIQSNPDPSVEPIECFDTWY